MKGELEMSTDYAVIGKRLPRIDAWEKATGEAVYVSDFKRPGMLTAKVLRSTIPHGRILDIDTSKAERLPGVKAVITGKDGPGVGRHGHPGTTGLPLPRGARPRAVAEVPLRRGNASTGDDTGLPPSGGVRPRSGP